MHIAGLKQESECVLRNRERPGRSASAWAGCCRGRHRRACRSCSAHWPDDPRSCRLYRPCHAFSVFGSCPLPRSSELELRPRCLGSLAHSTVNLMSIRRGHKPDDRLTVGTSGVTATPPRAGGRSRRADHLRHQVRIEDVATGRYGNTFVHVTQGPATLDQVSLAMPDTLLSHEGRPSYSPLTATRTSWHNDLCGPESRLDWIGPDASLENGCIWLFGGLDGPPLSSQAGRRS